MTTTSPTAGPPALGSPWASVIVRSFDSIGTVGATIASLRQQDVPVEIVVVDSGSTDGTLELVEAEADVVIRIPTAQFSYGGALNAGAAVSSAGVHAALSSHCVLPRPDWVRIAVEHVRQGAGAVCGLLRDGDGRELLSPFTADHAYVTEHPYWGFTNHASAWSAEVWRDYRFDERLRATEDKEWTFRAIRESRPLVVDPRLFVHGGHRRAAGTRRYYSRLVREMSTLDHLRPLPPFSALDAITAWSSKVSDDPAISEARRFGRTRSIEVAARWRAGGCRLARPLRPTST